MDKHTYLKKLSCIVRWRLPKPEADEVLADYTEMLSQRPAEDASNLVQDLGEPVQAARLLTEPKAYRRWMMAFCTMAFCILLLEYLLLSAQFHQRPTEMVFALLLVGLVVSLICFRPARGQGRQPLPKGLLPALVVLACGLLMAGWVLWCLATGAWQLLPPRSFGLLGGNILQLAGSAGAAAGLWGLVQARMTDRRWRALYVLGLAVLAECVLVLALLAGFALDGASPDWWVSYTIQWAAVGLLGLAGAGASLC